ncbi:MAG: EAL domain-containing protein [Clostridia bacterium]|nr:EAL domain-containing protein [Clostridia bacterium]
MFKSKIDSYKKEEQTPTSKEEINRQNRRAIHYLALASVPISIVNMLAQLMSSSGNAIGWHSFWIIGYCTALLLLDRFVIPARCRRATLLAYLLEAPIMAVSILLGTVWDPNYQALTYLMFMIVMPVFILDKPLRVVGVLLAWNAVFLILCFAVKAPKTHRGDVYHTIEFSLASIAVTFVVLHLRFEVIHNLERTKYSLEHDELTHTRNRHGLSARMQRYLDRPLFVALCNLDDLTLFNDFYGHAAGDEILCTFTDILKNAFGQDDTYRYGGDEILCIVIGGQEKECLERVEDCRMKLQASQRSRQLAKASCSVGYVTGTPKTVEEFSHMVQLADIYAHRGKKQGQNRTIGRPYNKESLREGIAESVLSNQAQAYETNQLTGLPSMSYFIAHTQEIVSHVAPKDLQLVVGFLKIQHMREFNNAFGYTQGDMLIRRTAQLLKESFPDRSVANINGGQFCFLCYQDEAQKGIDEINRGLADYKPGYSVQVKAGLAEYEKGKSVILLLDQAKLAHDSIFGRPDASLRCYDAQLDEENRFRHYLINHLDEAIEKKWLKVYYQAIVRSVTGNICNREALCRWEDPVYGLLEPGKFISPLEEERQLYKLTLFMVRQVLEDFKAMEEAGIPLVPVSVNVSRCDFDQCDILREITSLADASGYSRSLLKIEITESLFMKNPDMLRREVDRFRENGIGVWMDDFGSEYSTLNLLESLNFDLIKLDMQFMKNFSASGRSNIIITNILDMCKRLGIKTLVEGVETREQFEVLRELGCEKTQGFLFSRPTSLTDILSAKRAGADTLEMEQLALAPYYDAIGRIDLNSPLSFGGSDDFKEDRTLPAGILEDRGGEIYIINGNKDYYRFIRGFGGQPQETGRDGSLQISAAIPEFREVIRRAEASGKWEVITIVVPSGRSHRVCLRRISAHGDTTALLLVLLPG